MIATDVRMSAQLTSLQSLDSLVERLWYFESVFANGDRSGTSCAAGCSNGSIMMAGISRPPPLECAPDYSAEPGLAHCSHGQQQTAMGNGDGAAHDINQRMVLAHPEVVQQLRRYMMRLQLYQSDHDGAQQHLQPVTSVSSGGGSGVVVLDDQRLQRLRAVTYEDVIRAEAASSSSSSSAAASGRPASTQCDNDQLYLEDEDDEDPLDDLLAQVFDVYDLNQDGFISASELAHVLIRLGLLSFTPTSHDHDSDKQEQDAHNAVQSLCQTFIDRVDTDGNGLVDLHEFKAMMSTMRG